MMPRMAMLKGLGRMGTGWLPPLPDMRDYTVETEVVKTLSGRLGITLGSGRRLKGEGDLPENVDMRQWCSPIENQMQLGSCTAHAAVGIVEYFQRRAFSKHVDGSRLFVYKCTRNLMHEVGDTGAWLRDTMGALVLCGVAPEKYWPYTDSDPEFDEEPSPFVYAVADNYQAVSYFCHDPLGANVPGEDVLKSVKTYLAAGIPSMFGFFGFSSFENSDVKGGIPYPCPDEWAQWGHAIAAVGYDDKKRIRNQLCTKQTIGALLIRNSWGEAWGDDGYGWLPYDYVRHGLAQDFWSLLSMDWVETGQFGL
ncbi:cysteine protease [bacterium]|nr:cysteine protease [candidate division CSSED10-310 bacterium]